MTLKKYIYLEEYWYRYALKFHEKAFKIVVTVEG
jgi:hypothetical protein